MGVLSFYQIEGNLPRGWALASVAFRLAFGVQTSAHTSTPVYVSVYCGE